ncbi:MAG: DNA-binding response regulator [Chloroflexota bacterium]|nr:response regulator transcription factor [Anaerolineales bacterium]GIK38618.1 MAG: DNA-binding response regulator [Chloroflexota bacterium]
MEPLRILLVDDHVLFRKGIASLLAVRQDITIVGEASDGDEAVILAEQTMPDVILMDVNMPRQNGIETVKIIKREMPHIQIVMLTVSDDDNDLFEAIKSGAKGYLLKNLEPLELYGMLDRLRQGEAPISGAMAAKILREFRQPEYTQGKEAQPVDELTTREIEVLEQVVTGASNKEIADTLHITENTVKIHLRNILEKLHVQNRIQAAVYAVRQGLVDEALLANSPLE